MAFLKMKSAAAARQEAEPTEPPQEVEDMVFYDTETTGTDTAHDQVLQFGGIRTDMDFNIVGERVNERARRLEYVVPSPEALAVTGIDYGTLDNRELCSEFELAGRIHRFLKPETLDANRTCVTFNGIRFDDDILRHTFHRNLLDPYPLLSSRTTKIDLLRLSQLAFTACPGTFAVEPAGTKGRWKLESLARLNGIDIDAHDGLSDAMATMKLARLIHDSAAWAWNTARTCGNQTALGKELRRALDARATVWHFIHLEEPDLIPSAVVGDANGRAWLVFDLRRDPADIVPEHLSDSLESWRKQGFNKLSYNKMPLLVDDADVSRFRLDNEHDVFAERAARLMDNRDLVADLRRKFITLNRYPFPENATSEQRIYGGFSSREDKERSRRFRAAETWDERSAISFDDARLSDFACRILAMTAPENPTPEQLDTLTIVRNAAREALERPFRTDAVGWTTLISGAATADDAWLAWAHATFGNPAPGSLYRKAG